MTRVYKKINNNEYLRYYIFAVLCCLLILNSALYLFFVNLGVSEIFFKKDLLNKLDSLKQENQIIQGEYLENSKKITLEYAMEQGFVDAKSLIFINKTSVVAKSY